MYSELCLSIVLRILFEYCNGNSAIEADLYISSLPHGRLFDYLSSKTSYDEVTIATYMHQLLDVTQYLHNCRVAHLDIKPENIMVDSGNQLTEAFPSEFPFLM